MNPRHIAAVSIMVLFVMFTITSAQARPHHKKHHQQHYNILTGATRIVGHPSGCPGRAFCGCGVSVRVFGHPVRSLYLASNWFKFPHAAPSAGMVAVRNHHVMYIMSVDGNGNATVYDPNSGHHQTRIHTRSLAGYSIRNPHGAQLAEHRGSRTYAARSRATVHLAYQEIPH